MNDENENLEGSILETDRITGLRTRRLRARISLEARDRGLDPDQAWQAVQDDVLPAAAKGSIDHRGIAARYGFDPQKWIDFINAIMPLIMQFMAMCGA